MKWTSDDIKLVERFIEIKNKGFYCDGRQLTEVYNRVLEKRAAPTNCGSCIRNRINELEMALNSFKAAIAKEDKTNATGGQELASMDVVETDKPTRGRKKK